LTRTNGKRFRFLQHACCVHGVGQILLVGEDQQNGVTELVLSEHPQQLFAGLTHTIPIVAVNNEDQALRG
jgi:hypothetical protein